jgi:hypothetical protein
MILAPWRDLSIVWLAILAGIILLVPGVALFYAARGMRALNRWLRLPLLYAQLWALRIEGGTKRVADSAAQVPIRLHSANVRARITIRGVIDFLRGD